VAVGDAPHRNGNALLAPRKTIGLSFLPEGLPRPLGALLQTKVQPTRTRPCPEGTKLRAQFRAGWGASTCKCLGIIGLTFPSTGADPAPEWLSPGVSRIGCWQQRGRIGFDRFSPTLRTLLPDSLRRSKSDAFDYDNTAWYFNPPADTAGRIECPPVRHGTWALRDQPTEQRGAPH